MTIDLDDARLMFDRAKVHANEFNGLFGRLSPTPVWSIDRRIVGEEAVYSLRINRATLRLMKPIMADAANNLVHSLDHVAAACARATKTGRSMDLFFPIADDDAKFAKLEKKIRPRVGDAFMDLFAALRTRNRGPFHPSRYSYLALMREMAGGNKHWSLAPADAVANAVSWKQPGAPGQFIANIPDGHFENSDEFEFWRTAEIVPADQAFQIVLGLRLNGFASFPGASVDSAFAEATRMVEEVIDETEKLAGS